MRKLKILWLNWRCWLNPAMGGAEVFTREVAKRWAEDGNELTLLTSGFSGGKKEEVVDNVSIIRVGGRLSVYWRARRYYEKYLWKENFDVIIDEINTVPFFAPSFVKGQSKVIALIHQLAREFWFYETPFPVNYLGYYYFENNWLQRYRQVPTITVSESTRSDLDCLGFKKISVVPEGLNFVPLSEVAEKKTNPIVVFSGRLKKTKRPDHAIEAFRVVREKMPEAELWVIGDGPFRLKLEQSAGPGVKFFGHLSGAERHELIKQSWILVNPALREGWGLNVIEANALGTPCVGYSVHGLKDSIKDGVTGLLVKSGDFQALGESLVGLLENVQLRNILSENALHYAQGFSWDNTAEACMEVINRVLKEN